MSAPAQIFKAYDIRGLYGDEIDGDVSEQIGRAFVRVLASMHGKDAAELRIGLGRDMRLQAPEMAGRYRDGMVSEGAHVLDAGQVGTEMLYFLVGSQDLDGGLMCTASHNPAAYTGAKLVERGAVALSGDGGIGEIRDLLDAGLGDAPGGGSSEDVDVYADFHEAALKFIDTSVIKPLKVVVDGGNGMAGPMVGPLLEQLGLDLVTTYWTPDGSFPDHEPNPLLEENRRFIIDKVREEGADLGIAWDDDADSGTVPALLILELLSKKDAKLSELVEQFRSKYFISGEINSEVEDSDGKMAAIEEKFSDGEISKLDGISVDYDDWHFNVRASNTEPLLRLNLESLVSREDMERRRDEVLQLIRS